ncbi:MAG: response regulator transcription factor [Clostridia bacterium]|nr:response regulator transcription factor [Clostridia bacterium]
MNILVVEDEKRLADALGQILREQKYMVDTVHTGTDGLAYAESGIYDVVILDVMLPGMNGFEVISALRKKKVSTPVIMLTARSELGDKIRGLDSGADDYMTKPFEPGELLARIRVMTRRKGEIISDELVLSNTVYRASSNELFCSETGKHLQLSNKESEMLKLLISNPGRIISKEELITKIWGYDSEAGDNNVEAYISFLRKKLHHIGSDCSVITVKRLGYKLEAGNA